MLDIDKVISEIKTSLDNQKPILSEDQISRIYKIINPDIDDYIILGLRIAEIEKIARNAQNKFNPLFDEAKEIFKILANSNVEEYKFASFFFLNRYKKLFTNSIPEFFKTEFFPYCHTWSTCDSSCIRVLGPFLAKKGNEQLAKTTMNKWAQNESLWIKRASIVILLKIIMVHKEFSERYVFHKVEEMLNFSNENYIEKGIGWLLKTCSKYNPDSIFDYLMKNKERLPRLILRYASEKLSKEKRLLVLKK
ncbi:MAG: DNA alkylation repair protein [Promethearchaeota archaeon]|nr:MAG: DNA alkylation repair protein [Candidatus Lokiarchaeota archaeon]